MKTFNILSAAACFAMLSSAAVRADAAPDEWTPYFTIDALDNGDFGTFATFTVSSASGDFSNPHGCTAKDYAVMLSTLSSSAKELNNRVLLAAFLAGKQVKLRLSGSQCMNAGTASNGTTGSVSFSYVNVKE